MRSGLRNERVGDLIDTDIRVVVRKVNAVRTRVRDISEKPGWQLALNVEIPLLHVPFFRVVPGRQRGRTVCGNKSRSTWLCKSARRRQNSRATKGTCSRASETSKRLTSQGATAIVKSSSRRQAMIDRSKVRSGRQVDRIVVWIDVEIGVVRNPEDAVTSTDHRLLIPAVSKSEARRELFLVQGQVIPARVWTV